MLYQSLFRPYLLRASLCLLGTHVVPNPSVLAWEFPQPPDIRINQRPIHTGTYDEVNILDGSQFRGLKTFANLPYLNCLSDEEAVNKPYDIAIMGAPFDTVCLSQHHDIAHESIDKF